MQNSQTHTYIYIYFFFQLKIIKKEVMRSHLQSKVLEHHNLILKNKIRYNGKNYHLKKQLF